MSKFTVIGVAAVLSLTALAGCQRAAAVVDAATTPQPIYAEPVTGKVR
jgi:outer membrane murein-binding lipoprotein Lpp